MTDFSEGDEQTTQHTEVEKTDSIPTASRAGLLKPAKRRRHLFYDLSAGKIVTEVDPMRARSIKRIPTAPWERAILAEQARIEAAEEEALASARAAVPKPPWETETDVRVTSPLPMAKSIVPDSAGKGLAAPAAILELNVDLSKPPERPPRPPGLSTTDRFLKMTSHYAGRVRQQAARMSDRFDIVHGNRNVALNKGRVQRSSVPRAWADPVKLLLHRLVFLAAIALAGLAWWTLTRDLGLW